MPSTEPLSDEESLPSCDGTDKKYGYLVVDDEWYEIAVGETKIGRDASNCSIVLRDATLSMLHAVIESVGPEDSFIYDANSLNKTKIGKMRLKPHCRYKISDNDTIIMGNKIVQYRVVDYRIENCKTESSSNILKLCTSDDKENVTVTDKSKADDLVTVGNSVLNTGERAKKFDILKKSLSAPEEISNKSIKPYYILASELFNTDIFSQVTQCEIKNESSEVRNTESADSDDDIHNVEAQCDHFAGTDKAESELKCYKRSSEKFNKITESYFDDSATFDFVKRNESKHLLSSSFCKSISDDIFELPTQPQSKICESQKVLVDKHHNFRNCFSTELFNSNKSEEEFAGASKIESENNSCKTKTENLDSGEVGLEFFDDDGDEELYESMKAVSPGIIVNDVCIPGHGKKLAESEELKESNVPDEIFKIQNPFEVDLSNNKNFNPSKSEISDFVCNENEKCKLGQTNERRNGLPKIEQALKNSVEACTLMTYKVKGCNTKCISKRELQKGAGYLVDNRGEDTGGNISKFDPKDEECDGSRNTFQKYECIRRESVLPNDVASDLLIDEFESDSEARLTGEDFNRKGRKIKSPLVNETLNEVWKKQSNRSPAGSYKTLSDIDKSEFQGNCVTVSESDSEGDFISTQGLYSLNKSNSGKTDSKIEPGMRKTRSKLDVWKENWQDFIFTQSISDGSRRESGTESTDETESDIVVSTKPIPNIEDCEVNEMPSTEGVFNIDDNSSESECFIKKKIGDENSSSRDIGFEEEDFDEFICESPVLLQPNIPTEDIQYGEERNPIKSAEENVNKKYEPDRNRVVSDSDETDCEDELKAGELSFPLNNQLGEEIFPLTSDLKVKKSRKAKQLAKDNILSGKRDSSPLKRMMRIEKDVILPKKRSKSVRKKKESDDVGGRQLRSRGMTASRGRCKSEDGKAKNEVKRSCRKEVVNINVASTKKLGFVVEKSLNECDGLEDTCSEGRCQPPSVRIVFTGFESESHNRIISRLGGLRVDNFSEGNVLVTDKVRRTVKFLSAVALGLPIVSPKWLLSSNKELKFLDPWDFLLEDNASEERWGFNLKISLENWRKEKLLEGFNVFATKSTKPPVPEILSIAECCGGTAFASYPEAWPAKSIVLTCAEDKKSWPHYKYRNVKIVHYEFLLSGVLKHAMDFKTYKLR